MSHKHCQAILRTFCISTFPLKVGWLRDWGKLSDHQVSHFCSLRITERRISYLPFLSTSKMSIVHYIVHFSQTIYMDYPGVWRHRSFFFKKSRTVFYLPLVTEREHVMMLYFDMYCKNCRGEFFCFWNSQMEAGTFHSYYHITASWISKYLMRMRHQTNLCENH